MTQLQTSKPKQRLELITGKAFCPHCLGTNLTKTEEYVKCEDCGMGHYFAGRRLH